MKTQQQTQTANVQAVTATATATAKVEAVERPAEEPAAIAFREALASWNRGTSTRTTITDQDREKLDGLEQLCDSFTQAAQRHNDEPLVSSLGSKLRQYTNDTTGDEVISIRSLDGDREKLRPVVLSEDNRADLFRDGSEILARLEQAIQLGYARVKAEQESQRRLRECVKFWLAQPEVRTLIVSIITLADREALGKPEGALTTLRSVQRHIQHERERAREQVPEPFLIHGTHWREWLVVSRELLAEENEGAAS